MAEEKTADSNLNESQNKPLERENKVLAEDSLKKNASADFLTELSEIIVNLYYVSETDTSFEIFTVKRESGAKVFSIVNETDILRFAGYASDTAWREESLEDFFLLLTTEQDWYGDEEKEIVKRYVKLKELITQNLRDPQVFKIGEVEIEIYIAGIDADENITGVKTKAVET